MSKVKNNRILNVLILGIFSLLIVGLGFIIIFTPSEASARERAGYYEPYSNEFVNPYHDPMDNSITGNPAYNTSSPAPATNSGSVLGASTTRDTSTITESENKDYKGEFADLTANALAGEGGFLPGGILQWILVAILVLIIIILVRKLFGQEDHYHSTPLKHS